MAIFPERPSSFLSSFMCICVHIGVCMSYTHHIPTVGLYFDPSEVQMLKEYLEIWRPLLFKRKLFQATPNKASKDTKSDDDDDDHDDDETSDHETVAAGKSVEPVERVRHVFGVIPLFLANVPKLISYSAVIEHHGATTDTPFNMPVYLMARNVQCKACFCVIFV
jgi:hypothetical protein